MESLLAAITTGKTESLSIFSDPFKKENVESVIFYIRKDMFNKEKIAHSSTIEFKNGATMGRQSVVAENLQSLIKKTEEVIKSLP